MWGMLKDLLSLPYKILTFCYRGMKRIFSFRSKRKFLNNVWNPFLANLNKKLDSVYSKSVLMPVPEVIVENNVEKARIYGKIITVPLNLHDIQNQSISSESFEQLFQAIHRCRTAKFRKHIPIDIKRSLDYVVETEIGWILKQESSTVNFDEEELPYLSDEENKTEMIEDIYYAQELVPVLYNIIEEYGSEKPDSRIHDQTRNVFEKKYTEIQHQNRGIFCEVNPTRINYLQKGLRAIMAPVERDFPEKCHDWHIFFWKRKDREIIATAEIRNFYKNSFDQLWSKYNKDLMRINGKTGQESYNIHENWAKGIGAKSRPRKRRKGYPKEMTLIKITKFRDLLNPIPEAEVSDLIGRPLDRFCLITQKQVRALLQLC